MKSLISSYLSSRRSVRIEETIVDVAENDDTSGIEQQNSSSAAKPNAQVAESQKSSPIEPTPPSPTPSASKSGQHQQLGLNIKFIDDNDSDSTSNHLALSSSRSTTPPPPPPPTSQQTIANNSTNFFNGKFLIIFFLFCFVFMEFVVFLFHIHETNEIVKE